MIADLSSRYKEPTQVKHKEGKVYDIWTIYFSKWQINKYIDKTTGRDREKEKGKKEKRESMKGNKRRCYVAQ